MGEFPNKDTQFKPGESGNPGGRPKGTLKHYVREKFIAMSEDQKEEFIKDIAKDTIWKMGEGNPDNKDEVTVKDETSNLSPEALEVAKKYEEELNALEDERPRKVNMTSFPSGKLTEQVLNKLEDGKGN